MAEISNNSMKIYPDISRLLDAKEKKRKELAKRPIAEKLEMATKMKNAAMLIKNSERITNK